MVKDILLALPTFRNRTDRGDATLLKLLSKIQNSFSTEMSSSSRALPNTLSLLDAAHLWVVSSARPLTLFRFYFNSIVNDIYSFETRAQVAVICNITKMLQFYLENPTLHDTYAALKQATDRSLPLLKVRFSRAPLRFLTGAFALRYWLILNLRMRRHGKHVAYFWKLFLL
jgi:hypothetical protein